MKEIPAYLQDTNGLGPICMTKRPPIHKPKGVFYWDEDLQEYLLDPTPDMHTPPPDDIKQGWKPGDITD